MMHASIDTNNLPKAIKCGELRPGDIICYLPQPHTSFVKEVAQSTVCFFQYFQSDQTSHTATVHVGIYVGNGYVAHMNKNGYLLSQIGNQRYPDYSLSRPFNVYRPNNQQAADRLAEFAFFFEEIRSKFSYSFNSVVKTIWVEKNEIDSKKPIKKNKKNLPSKMMCSEFTIRLMKKAWTNDNNEKIEGFPYPNIRSVVSPKILEDYLSVHPEFTKMIYLGIHSFKTFFNLVLGELAKTKMSSDMSRLSPIHVKINEIMYSILKNHELNDLQRIFIAYQEIQSEIHTILSEESLVKIDNFIHKLRTYHAIGNLDAELEEQILRSATLISNSPFFLEYYAIQPNRKTF